MQFEYGAISNAKEAQQLTAVLAQCFNAPAGTEEAYSKIIGQDNFRILPQAGRIAGGLAILNVAQWFGAKPVPMAGIASVGIAPEYRGTGAAVELMRQTLRELHDKGIPISTLYPATQYLYRKVGYEQAGVLCNWEMPLDTIRVWPGDASLRQIREIPIQSVSSPHWHVFDGLYKQQAKCTNGFLERHQFNWEVKLDARNEAIYAYLIGEDSQPEGYVIFSQKQVGDRNHIYIRDWALLTAEASKRFWAFIADHRSQIEKVHWRSSIVDPLTLLLSEQSATVAHAIRWMLRIVSVPKALEGRGYPQDVEAELHLEVTDNLLAENNGKFILTVAGGSGEVRQGGRGELQLNVRGLSPLYTGLFSPQQLQQTGQLAATPSALSVATQIFAGPIPWTTDFF